MHTKLSNMYHKSKKLSINLSDNKPKSITPKLTNIDDSYIFQNN